LWTLSHEIEAGGMYAKNTDKAMAACYRGGEAIVVLCLVVQSALLAKWPALLWENTNTL
jgi:hypothetical protein